MVLVMAYLFLGPGQVMSGQEECVARARTHVDVAFCGERDREYLRQKTERRTEFAPLRRGGQP